MDLDKILAEYEKSLDDEESKESPQLNRRKISTLNDVDLDMGSI